MIFEHDRVAPRIHPSARVAPTAVVCGDVSIGPNTSIGFGAVLTAESGPVEIGATPRSGPGPETDTPLTTTAPP